MKCLADSILQNDLVYTVPDKFHKETNQYAHI